MKSLKKTSKAKTTKSLKSHAEYRKTLLRLRAEHGPLRPVLKLLPKGSTTLNKTKTAYLTTTALGTKIAWDNCGRCYAHVLLCKCDSGPTAPRSIEYIYDQDMALSKGEEWGPGHRNYKGTFRAKHAKKERTTFWMPEPTVPQTSVADEPVRKRKSLTKTLTSDDAKLLSDKKSLDRRAASAEKSSTEQVLKLLKGKKR